MSNSLPQQQQEMLSQTLNAAEQNWPLGDTGQGRRTKISQKERKRKEMARRSTAAEYLLNEEAMLCYSKRIRGLSCSNSAPTTMGSLINKRD